MTRLVPFHWPQVEPDFEPLLHPSWAFDHPRDVVKDPDLTRHPPGAKRPVTFDEVLDALQSLDDDPPPRPGGTSMRLRYGQSGPDQGHHGGAQL